MAFEKSELTHVIFDVDGTLYDKKREYKLGKGSIEDAHEFFRYNTFSQALESKRKFNQDDLINRVVEEYKKRNREGTLLKAIEKFPGEIKNRYKELLKKHGSNGKVFVNEFDADSGFFARIVGNVDFEAILTEDKELQKMVQELKQKGYKLGILTTEVYNTVQTIADILGISLDDFKLETGTQYPMLCSENVKEKKPSPEGFQKLIHLTNVVSPKQIVYVGDHFKKDIEASLNCGLQAVQVAYDGTGKNSFESCLIKGKQEQFAKIDKVYDLTKIL